MRNRVLHRLNQVASTHTQAVRCEGSGYLGYLDPTFFEPSHVIFMHMVCPPKLHDRVQKRWDLGILGILASPNGNFACSGNSSGLNDA